MPGGLLFADQETRDHANRVSNEQERYRLGLAVVESKRWLCPLGRHSGRETAPSTQMLRYLRRVDDLAGGGLRWGILANGARFRLYYQGAQSVSEQFFETDLARLLDLPLHNDDLSALSEDDRRHGLKIFALVFGRDSFLVPPGENKTFHHRALDEGRFYQRRVAANLSDRVFRQIFPELAKAIAEAAPDAALGEVRDASLILLYRLLFILYAEDRGLLPVRDRRYSLRLTVRDDVGRRKDRDEIFPETAARYWSRIHDLCRALDRGDPSIGLPPCSGGLFDEKRAKLLSRIRLGDALMANIIDALSFEKTKQGRRYIDYRDLGVRQLGAIYECLLGYEIIRGRDGIAVRPDIFARKGSGSYYTPDDLVRLIIKETVAPLIAARMNAFADLATLFGKSREKKEYLLKELQKLDPASSLLKLRICDPAMGSGHFLVALVDYLADRVVDAMAEAQAIVTWGAYISPLGRRVNDMRDAILAHAGKNNWVMDAEQLDDCRIIRHMVLKHCIHGVDKNDMAVELAKISLWLHSFISGAPLSFLDHHFRCGDSLFGSWVRAGIDRAEAYGRPLLLDDPIQQAMDVAIEDQTDAGGIADIEEKTAPLDKFLSLIHGFDWLYLRAREDKAAIHAYFDGALGDPIDIAMGKIEPSGTTKQGKRFAERLREVRELIAEEGFFHWQTAFPCIWSEWRSAKPTGGFDAIIGNPPWDRIKLQQVEWFAMRKRDIAMALLASDRKRMIADLEKNHDPLARDFTKANERAEASARIARTCGDYPLLSGGDINLYSLFVERAMALIKPEGRVGLLVPSGIASDKTAAPFFKNVASEGRLQALYDFENRKTFFPDIHASFKFCAFIASCQPMESPAKCAFFLQNISEIDDPERCFPLTAADFACVNPNTGTAPIFRTGRDARLTLAIYSRLPVLVDRSSGGEVKAWPVKYMRMFDMTNDSGLFRTCRELEEKEGAWPIGGNRFAGKDGEWLPLYEGKMVQAFDHRAASIVVNRKNRHRPAQPEPATPEQHQNPDWLPEPQFRVLRSKISLPAMPCLLTFKHVTATTNMRSMIVAMIPFSGAGNSLPIVSMDGGTAIDSAFLLANFNAIPFDYVARQKIQGQNLNWFVVEQLPVIPPGHYDSVRFGSRTAGEIVRRAVLELTYTAHDMAPFAIAMGHVDQTGAVKPPFPWDEERRFKLRARLDAVFFHLYGITDRNDIRYIYSTFPIVERQETGIYGHYRSRDLCLAWVSALAAGEPDAKIDL